jgi:hypothetical protein
MPSSCQPAAVPGLQGPPRLFVRVFLTLCALHHPCTRSVSGAAAALLPAAAAKADDTTGVASSRMSYSRFLEYLDMGRVKKVGVVGSGGWWQQSAGVVPAPLLGVGPQLVHDEQASQPWCMRLWRALGGCHHTHTAGCQQLWPCGAAAPQVARMQHNRPAFPSRSARVWHVCSMPWCPSCSVVQTPAGMTGVHRVAAGEYALACWCREHSLN